MNSIQLIFADSMENVFTALSSASLQVWLLVGSGILAVSLLVLALTKWGHSRPVWKCVILSFIAHILLMGYAYATYVMLDQPAAVAITETMQVNLIEEVGESMEAMAKNETHSSDQQSKWDQVADQSIETPDLEPLDRPLIDSEVVVEPSPRPARPIADQLTAATLPLTAPETDDNAFESTKLPNALVQNDFSKRDPRPFDVKAQPIEIARKTQQSGQSLTDMPDFDNDFQKDLPREQIEPLAAGSSELAKPKRQITRPMPPTNQLRFAGQQPLDDQLSNATDGILLDRQTSNGSSSGNGQLTVVKRRRRLGDGQPLPEVYSLRAPQERLKAAIKHGGSARTERAVNAAFGWLVTNQQTDGSWSAAKTGAGRETKTFGHDRNGAGRNANTGVTALATLSLLAGGHSHFEGNYRQNVQRALEYLISQQSNDGNLAGDAKLFARMYCHSMSLLALSEALAMTGDQRLMPAVQRGVDYCVNAQNRDDGGWRYQPGDGGDMSQFGWIVMALRSARLGGAHVPARTFQQMRRFLKKCSSGVGGALASYRPGQGASTSMTAEALFCRYLLDDVPARDGLRIASARIGQESPSPNQVNLYYWYYGTLAMRHVGGDAWQRWNNRLKGTLVALQETSGKNAGSWDPNGVWGGYGGRVYSTAMAALNLEVYYRYLPSHEFTKGNHEVRVGQVPNRIIQLK
jgi:hypothetical protein